VTLLEHKLKWKGIADLVEIGWQSCAITDFKTGDRSESHKLQLLIYALLWRGDTELNPKSSLATRLVLSYTEKEEEQAVPTGEELDKLAAELQIKTQAVRQQIDTEMPTANVSEQNCTSCQVRSICKDYWNPAKRPRLSVRQDAKDDLEVVLREQRGQTTWEAECRVSSLISPSSIILIRGTASDTILSEHFRPGMSIRLTDAYVVLRELGEIPLVHFTNSTEPLFL
jgi:hypothetical protein